MPLRGVVLLVLMSDLVVDEELPHFPLLSLDHLRDFVVVLGHYFLHERGIHERAKGLFSEDLLIHLHHLIFPFEKSHLRGHRELHLLGFQIGKEPSEELLRLVELSLLRIDHIGDFAYGDGLEVLHTGSFEFLYETHILQRRHDDIHRGARRPDVLGEDRRRLWTELQEPQKSLRFLVRRPEAGDELLHVNMLLKNTDKSIILVLGLGSTLKCWIIAVGHPVESALAVLSVEIKGSFLQLNPSLLLLCFEPVFHVILPWSSL